MKIDCVFSGGGVKAYSFLGALEALENRNVEIERVAGTSAGAVIASLLVANYTSKEINNIILDLQLNQLLDPPVLSRVPLMKWFLFYFQKGLYKGDRFEKWLTDLLVKKGIRTFYDVEPNCLKVIVSDISLGKLIIIPDDLKRVYNIDPNTFSVATAVRMSAGFPYFFMPKILLNTSNRESYMVDGGLLSNFPLWIFSQLNKNIRPVLGITLSDDIENSKSYPIHNAFDMLQAVFHTMQRAHDTRYVAKSMEENIIFIPVKEVKTMDMTINKSDKQTLIRLGRERTELFLKRWP